MPSIERHRTAIGRNRLSKPFRLACDLGILTKDFSILDFGCGRGDDLRRLAASGFTVEGWDPNHRPLGSLVPAGIVNLGYVLNVIEDTEERLETLVSAWRLAEHALIVSTLVSVDAGARAVPFGDGIVTSRATFQKVFEQKELEQYIITALGVAPIAIALGVFVAFRSPADAAKFVSARYRRRPRPAQDASFGQAFAPNLELLAPLVEFFQLRGRPPSEREFSVFVDAVSAAGGRRRAVDHVKRLVGPERLEAAESSARADLLVYLALANLSGQLAFGDLDVGLQEDVRTWFQTFKKAKDLAGSLLAAAGSMERLRAEARGAVVGKLLPDGLYVHVDAVAQLPVLLRIYEGCARRYVGGVEGATIVKLRLNYPVVSYLSYPRFDDEGHPALEHGVRVDLQTLKVGVDDYSLRENPPILHRKELFVSKDYPRYQDFAALTKAEEASGVLTEDPHRIGTRAAWEELLRRKGLGVRGHELIDLISNGEGGGGHRES